MATSVVGSVTAELILDSSNFTSGLETAKQQIKGLSGGISTGGLETFKKKITETNNETKKLKENLANLGKVQYGNPFAGWVDPMEQVVQGMEKVNKGLFQQQEKLRLLKDEWLSFKVIYNGLLSTKPMNTWLKDMEKANAETEKFSQKFIRLKEIMHYGGYNGSIVSQEAVKNMALLNKEMSATENWSKYLRNASVTMQDYYKNLNLVTQKMKEYEVTQQRLATKTSLGGMVNNVSGQIKQLRDSTGVSVSNRNAQLLSMEAEAVNRLKNAGLSANAELTKFAEAQARLGNSLTTTNPKFAEQISYLNRLKSSEDQASASATKLGNSTRQASSSMNTLTGATSKLQGALSSVKMMATALSSMFVWTFGMSLYEATKQTLQSKNEMESYLNQMGMGRGAINLFNQGLDETADRFKKLNKYMIGETIASIGMEFDLTANQMKKSMEVVAMVQNEYVRAGRKESEASLAVKDILQGEFLRLSRETGVGKQDLIDTGLWQGDLKDVEGLMDALKKVGEDRHWDLFASKCLSLNDVIQETKNRISEFGASLVDQFSPAIVNGFNIIVDIIDKVTSTWNNFNPMEKLAVGIPTVFAFGTALMMVAGKLNLVDIAQMGYARSLLATLFQLDVATVKEYGLATAIGVKLTSLEAEEVAYTGTLTALTAKMFGVDAYILKEYGLATAINVSTGALDISTMSYDANTVAQAFNNTVTEEGTAVVGGFTIVKELEQSVMQSDTALTEFNTIAHELNKTAIEEETVSLWGLIGAMTALKAVAIIAVIAGIAVALGSLAMEAQRAKEAVDGFYDIVDNGDSYVEEGQKSVEGYTEQINNLTQALAEAEAQGKDTFQINKDLEVAKANKQVAESNLKDIQNVNEIAKKDAEKFQKQISMANTDFERKNKEIFEKMGIETNKATEMASNYTQKYLDGMDQMRTATQAYTRELEEGSKHIDENVESLQQQGVKQENLNEYVKEYGKEVLKNAQYQKEWAEGDFWAIFKIGLSDIKLAWIDFTAFMSQYEWAKDLAELTGQIKDNIKNVYSDDFKKLGEDVKLLCDLLDELYHWVKGEKGQKTEEYLNELNNNHPEQNPANYMENNGQFDILPYVEDNIQAFPQKISKVITDTFTSPTAGIVGFPMMLMKWLLPTDFATEMETTLTQFISDGFKNFDWIGKIFDSIFNSGSGSQGNSGGGVAKKINFPQWLASWFGNIDFNGLSEWFNENIASPFGEVVSNFISNPLGSMGISFDIGQFLSNIFGGVESAFEPVMSFINNNIITPFTDGLNQFISNPLMFMADLGMGLGIGGLLNGLFGGENGDASFSISTWVNNNIILPFTQSIQMGLLNIPIIGDIISFLGLADSPEVQGTANQKGSNIGGSFGQAVENKIRSIPILGDVLAWLGVIDGANPTANQKGHNVGHNIHDGVDSGKAGTADLVRNEMVEIISAIAGKVGEAYAQAQAIGGAILNGINSIIQHHSPGIPAQLIGAEMGEIVLSMDNAYDSIYESAQNIGYAITSGIQPNTDINFDAEAMAQYQADTMMAMGMADETVYTTESAFSQLDMNTATTFSSIGTTIGTTMTNIANNTKLQYSNIALTTKTQLTNMQSQTTKNIGAIKQSWTGMQVALIASAEHIRSETGAKIHSLQNNMATFWRKVQNPALLLGAGSPSEDHGRRTRYGSHTSGVRKILSPSGFAGSPTISRSNSNPRGARTGTGISDKLPNRTVNGIKIYDILTEYLECLKEGKPCYAGGWDFNWSDEIRQALLQWHTHFGDIYDPYLYVGKFENDNFPIRGIAPIALRYIEDAISRTSYSFYYDSRYSSPLEAWNAGSFNCYDGALVVMALASALGFPNSTMVHGSWNGIAHVWARIAGLGDIDATAIQGGYGLTAPSKYAGGDIVRPRFKHKGGSSDNNGGTGDIHINIDLSGATISDDSIGERIGRKVRDEIIDLVSPNPSTGI